MAFERVHFRLIRVPCCGQMLCWVNPRLPNFCPECGQKVYAQIRFPEGDTPILLSDATAQLKYNDGEVSTQPQEE
jgi:hypothetical protein